MTQNIYDNETFFQGYSQLERSTDGLDGAAEWPALRALLPDLNGRTVVDLGCGFGWFSRFACQQGAVRVQGFDVSEKMLARARQQTTDAAITYTRADLERLELPPDSVDLVYSSLVLHYIERLDALVAQIGRALVPGGRFIFSVEHPIYTAPSQPGWTSGADGRRAWPVNGYLDEGPRSTDWLAEGVIKQHRTIATYLTLLLQSGLSLRHIEEWGPTPAQLAARPEWADEHQRPPFLLIAASR